MARKRSRQHALKTANGIAGRLHPALENLKERLSSPRLKAATTISTYLGTGAKFLSTLGKDRQATDSDFRRYFARRRREGRSGCLHRDPRAANEECGFLDRPVSFRKTHDPHPSVEEEGERQESAHGRGPAE